MTMTGLGIFFDGFHDSNVSFMNDHGCIEKAVAEERFTRNIQDGNTPIQSFRWIQNQGQSFDYCVIPGLSFDESIKQINDQAQSADLVRIFANFREKKIRALGLEHLDRVYVPHLQAHASSAFFCSNFDEAYILVADGGNIWDPWTCALYHGKGKLLSCIDAGDYEFTDLYMFATALLGFKPNRHEGKLTGLASYHEENLLLREKFCELRYQFRLSKKTLASQYLKWKDVASKPRLVVDQNKIQQISGPFPDYNREQVAYEAQLLTEQEVVQYLKKHLPTFDLPICVAGGLFANIKLNKTLLDIGFPNIYIHPAMGDAGLSVGGLSFVGSTKGQRNFLKNVCLGPSYSDDDIVQALQKFKLNYVWQENIEGFIAQRLVDGKLVGRMDGPLEYGPRALGNRSILCNAQNRKQIELLNGNLKRDEFMPFAPSVLEEHFEECVVNGNIMKEPSQWMTIACDATQTFKNYAPALVHVDNTIRPQCVSKELYPTFHKILSEYYNITGVPVVLNTSFNMHGEPIICSPENAIETFIMAKIDILTIGNYVVFR